MSFSRRLRSYFFRGLAVLLPTVLTIWIFVLAYSFIQDKLGNHLKVGLEWLIPRITSSSFFDNLDDRWWKVALSAASFLIVVLITCIVGALLASVVGRSLWRMIENFIMNTPFLRRVYPYIKQITDFLLTQEEQKKLFSRVVAVEYPRKDIWSIGFVTGSGIQKVVDNVKKEFLTVLIPTSPTPFTGFVIMVPKKQTIELEMTVEEALRFTVSAGVIAPGSEHIAVLPKAMGENKEE